MSYVFVSDGFEQLFLSFQMESIFGFLFSASQLYQFLQFSFMMILKYSTVGIFCFHSYNLKVVCNMTEHFFLCSWKLNFKKCSCYKLENLLWVRKFWWHCKNHDGSFRYKILFFFTKLIDSKTSVQNSEVSFEKKIKVWNVNGS